MVVHVCNHHLTAEIMVKHHHISLHFMTKKIFKRKLILMLN